MGGLLAFVALILFIVAHEAGHYFAAKATGMKVTEFFLGFGPRIWSFRRGETEYGIKPIPLGAYVKVIGMNHLEEVEPEDLDRTYRVKPFWAKSFVVLSGVAANFLIAYLMFVGIAIAQGEPAVTNSVGGVVETDDAGQPTAAAAADLRPDDVIVSVDGEPTPTWDDVAASLGDRPDDTVVLGLDRNGALIDVPVTLGSRVDPDSGETRGFLGVSPLVVREPIGVGEAMVTGGRQVVSGVELTFVSFGRLILPDTLIQLVGGVFGGEIDDEVRPVSLVGIVQLGNQSETFGITNLLFVLALINVVLGTLNALPLYPLDGGHFAVALYEKIRGRPADVQKLIPVAVTVIGLISIIGLLAVVLDIVNPIQF